MSDATDTAKSFQDRFRVLADNIGKFIKGKPDAVTLALVCLFAEGHLLIEGVPGVAKTSLAKAIAQSIRGAEVKRIQFTPDLLPSDVAGVQIYRPDDKAFEFVKGPVFANIVIADEINRASPKTQSALLEVMAERQVTVEGRTRPVPDPFLCIATQNPIEHHGTYALPEAQLDRFMMRISLGYPAEPEDEVEIVTGGIQRRTPKALPAVLKLEDLQDMIKIARHVHVSHKVQHYIVQIAKRTRERPDVQLAVSPRGSIALATAAQAYAASRGQDFVIDDDVKAVAVPVLNHRLVLTPDARIRRVDPVAIIDELVDGARGVPVPGSRGR